MILNFGERKNSIFEWCDNVNSFAKFLLKFMKILSEKYYGIYYINGPDTLPPPLSREEEAEIIERLCDDGESNSDAALRSTLVEHNLRLVVYIAKKFENTGLGIEDLISIGTIGLIKAINTFKSDKNIKLATYASRCIENEILMFIRKTSNQRTEMSIEEPLSTDWDGNELLLSDVLYGDEDSIWINLENSEERRTVHQALDKLSERERKIIVLRFGINGERERTQREVADMLGISQSYISRLEKRIINQLKEEIETRV